MQFATLCLYFVHVSVDSSFGDDRETVFFLFLYAPLANIALYDHVSGARFRRLPNTLSCVLLEQQVLQSRTHMRPVLGRDELFDPAHKSRVFLRRLDRQLVLDLLARFGDTA